MRDCILCTEVLGSSDKSLGKPNESQQCLNESSECLKEFQESPVSLNVF